MDEKRRFGPCRAAAGAPIPPGYLSITDFQFTGIAAAPRIADFAAKQFETDGADDPCE
jgi:hypothetical protein